MVVGRGGIAAHGAVGGELFRGFLDTYRSKRTLQRFYDGPRGAGVVDRPRDGGVVPLAQG
jgi:hypothetical protein